MFWGFLCISWVASVLLSRHLQSILSKQGNLGSFIPKCYETSCFAQLFSAGTDVCEPTFAFYNPSENIREVR